MKRQLVVLTGVNSNDHSSLLVCAAAGLLSAQEKRTDGTTFSARVRFLAALVKHDGVWQLVATQSTPIKPRSTARIEQGDE